MPKSSSECDLGEGTFTLENDPETGERGVKVEFPEKNAPESDVVQACEVKIDYQSPVSAQGDVSAQSTNTRGYVGTKPAQEDIDEVVGETQDAGDEPVSEGGGPETPITRSGDITAQYAWTVGRYNVVVRTEDVATTDLNRTRHKLYWWYNGNDVDYYSYSRPYGAYGGCWAAYPSAFNTYWYKQWCKFPYTPWYGYNSYLSWIGNEIQAQYYNEDFPNGYGYRDGKYTYAWHKSRIWGYHNGTASYSADWEFWGQYWWILYGHVYAYR